jgi:hypothetical protein
VPKARSGEGAGGEGKGITTSRSVYSLEKPYSASIVYHDDDAQSINVTAQVPRISALKSST